MSFVPAKGAVPDSDGVYGMVKIRGTFATEEEAMLRAEYLIRNVDSYHSVYHTYVGRPFPVSQSKKYITETTEIDIKKKVVESTSQEVRKKRDEERQVMKEIEERQQELLADVEKKEDDPYDVYTELMVKKAQLSWTYHQTQQKMEDMKKNIIKAREEIAKMKEENEDYQQKYMDKYMDARKKAGLPQDDNSFIKYMVEDIDIGF
jgi:cell division protein FtsL